MLHFFQNLPEIKLCTEPEEYGTDPRQPENQTEHTCIRRISEQVCDIYYHNEERNRPHESPAPEVRPKAVPKIRQIYTPSGLGGMAEVN